MKEMKQRNVSADLIREFEMQEMKDSEIVKEYSDRFLSIVIKVRLLGTEFSNYRIVQKILVTIPKKFEVTISSSKNLKRSIKHHLGGIDECTTSTRTNEAYEAKKIYGGCFSSQITEQHCRKNRKN